MEAIKVYSSSGNKTFSADYGHTVIKGIKMLNINGVRHHIPKHKNNIVFVVFKGKYLLAWLNFFYVNCNVMVLLYKFAKVLGDKRATGFVVTDGYFSVYSTLELVYNKGGGVKVFHNLHCVGEQSLALCSEHNIPLCSGKKVCTKLLFHLNNSSGNSALRYKVLPCCLGKI